MRIYNEIDPSSLLFHLLMKLSLNKKQKSGDESIFCDDRFNFNVITMTSHISYWINFECEHFIYCVFTSSKSSLFHNSHIDSRAILFQCVGQLLNT